MVCMDLDVRYRSSFTTTMWMVIRVHYGTTNCRSDTHVTFTSGFTDVNQVVISVSDTYQQMRGIRSEPFSSHQMADEVLRICLL